MAMRSVIVSRIGLSRLTQCNSVRCFSDGKGRVLDEEGRAKETVYIHKMEKEKSEKLEKLKKKADQDNKKLDDKSDNKKAE